MLVICVNGLRNNWGDALVEQAKQTTGEESDPLSARAATKYEGALAIKL
jgi:hypothetical protein